MVPDFAGLKQFLIVCAVVALIVGVALGILAEHLILHPHFG